MRNGEAAPGVVRLSGGADRGGAGGLRVADVAVEHEERYWYPDDGSIVWVAGYTIVDPATSRYLAVSLAAALDAGRAWSAVVLRERRPSPRDPRSGPTMLLAPATAIELREPECDH